MVETVGSRYSIRAGRNLPDKGISLYLRMVIVTTAVYWGLNSQLRPKGLTVILLTFQHRAGVSPYASSYDFARTCVFDKQSLPPWSLRPIHAPGSKCPSLKVPPSPEVTGHFAEFLNHDSLDRLSILYHDHLCRFRVRAG